MKNVQAGLLVVLAILSGRSLTSAQNPEWFFDPRFKDFAPAGRPQISDSFFDSEFRGFSPPVFPKDPEIFFDFQFQEFAPFQPAFRSPIPRPVLDTKFAVHPNRFKHPTLQKGAKIVVSNEPEDLRGGPPYLPPAAPPKGFYILSFKKLPKF